MSTYPAVQHPLGFVCALVTGNAVELERLAQLDQSMIDREVAQLALDIVFGQMNLVHESRVFVLRDPLRLIVAPVTA
jgi:hypothetical protein